MALVLNGPIWFRGIDTIFTFVFALITLLVAMLSYKAYRLTEEKRHKYFTMAFFLISAAFISNGLFTSLLITHMSEYLANIIGFFDFVFLA
ncbi:MAG: hypothetical protein Q8Q35_03925, partial [Nanoarchaeota archaeon]|nr:hypothetical protein [Nanoarchaeota archaeon]